MSTACGTITRLPGTITLLKTFSLKGASLQKYSFQSYAHCLATAPSHDEQVLQVWC